MDGQLRTERGEKISTPSPINVTMIKVRMFLSLLCRRRFNRERESSFALVFVGRTADRNLWVELLLSVETRAWLTRWRRRFFWAANTHNDDARKSTTNLIKNHLLTPFPTFKMRTFLRLHPELVFLCRFGSYRYTDYRVTPLRWTGINWIPRLGPTGTYSYVYKVNLAYNELSASPNLILIMRLLLRPVHLELCSVRFWAL